MSFNIQKDFVLPKDEFAHRLLDDESLILSPELEKACEQVQVGAMIMALNEGWGEHDQQVEISESDPKNLQMAKTVWNHLHSIFIAPDAGTPISHNVNKATSYSRIIGVIATKEARNQLELQGQDHAVQIIDHGMKDIIQGIEKKFSYEESYKDFIGFLQEPGYVSRAQNEVIRRPNPQ